MTCRGLTIARLIAALTSAGLPPRGKCMDTVSFRLYYSFF
jgi:hypothetical protein